MNAVSSYVLYVINECSIKKEGWSDAVKKDGEIDFFTIQPLLKQQGETEAVFFPTKSSECAIYQ